MIRLAPPLVIDRKDLDWVLDQVAAVLTTADPNAVGDEALVVAS